MHEGFQAALEKREETIRRVASILGREKSLVPTNPGEPQHVVLEFATEDSTVMRHITLQEKETLQRDCRCTCKHDEWSGIFLLLKNGDSADKSPDLKRLVSDTYFDGQIILDFTETEMDSRQAQKSQWHALPLGLHSNTYVANSIFRIESCRVYKNSFVSKTFVGSNAVLMNCGHVSISGKAELHGSIHITVGAESGGGRSLSLTAESTMMDVCQQLDPSWNTRESIPPPLPSPSDAFVALSTSADHFTYSLSSALVVALANCGCPLSSLRKALRPPNFSSKALRSLGVHPSRSIALSLRNARMLLAFRAASFSESS